MARRVRVVLVLVALLLGLTTLTPTPAGAAPLSIEATAYDDPGISDPESITPGPDGNLWFVDPDADQIGRVTTGGTISLFDDADGEVAIPRDIAAGPDGALWFTSFSNDRIGRITTSGDITTFDVGVSGADVPIGITTGPDDNLWFAAAGSSGVGRITPAGVATHFFDVSMNAPQEIISGPGGHLWVTAFSASKLARVTTAGVITLFTDPSGETSLPRGLVEGLDGNVWFTNTDVGTIGRITPSGTFTSFDADEIVGPEHLALGPDDQLWLTDSSSGIVKLRCHDGLPFTDVSPSHPFAAEICWMSSEGVSTGFEDGTYKPAIAVSRQAMSAFMFRLAGEPAFDPPVSQSFTDVGPAHPFFAEIEWMADAGISDGFLPGPTYKPGAAVSRQAMSAFLYRLAGEPAFVVPGVTTFTDVSLSHPFFAEIEWMADEGISEGFLPGPTYKPGAAVSRQAMSAFMQRFGEGTPVNV